MRDKWASRQGRLRSSPNLLEILTSRVQARVSHIQAVIPLCERLRQEEFLQNNCHLGALILAEGRESVAARAGEINGTDKRNRYQNYQRGEQG